MDHSIDKTELDRRLANLESAMKKHIWNYLYLNDTGAWQRYDQNQMFIMREAHALRSAGYVAQVDQLFSTYNPV